MRGRPKGYRMSEASKRRTSQTQIINSWVRQGIVKVTSDPRVFDAGAGVMITLPWRGPDEETYHGVRYEIQVMKV
jgi:hypothetical protein